MEKSNVNTINQLPLEVLGGLIQSYLSNLPYDRKPYSLYEPIKYVLDLGGKRIRPMLMLMSYNLYKDDPESILPQAIGLETYHNYTLLHDDLMDNADVRRGQPTVHKKWDANTAILSGDSMLVLAYQRMQNCPADKLPAVLDCFTTTALEIGEGQQYDMEFETRDDVREEEYIEMIRLKTSVLLACAMKIGAIMADAPKEDVELLYRFGERMGLAFQLQDDFLDVYGDPKVFGKAIGGDITSNKKTYMLINAFNKAEGETKAELSRWIAAKEFDRQEKVAAVTAIYNKLGIDLMAKAKMEEYYHEAIEALDKVSVAEEKKTALREYAAKMMKRAGGEAVSFIDTHTHIDGEEFKDDLDEVVARAKEAGAIQLLCPGINYDSIATMKTVCERFPDFIRPMIGLHPEDVKEDYKEVLDKMHLEIRNDNYIAIGEVGLDYYWSREFEKEQLDAFEQQVQWSVETQLPLMIHCRKAQNEMVKIIRRYEKELPGGVFHCFTGNQHEAVELLQFEKFVLGIGGVSTFKKSHLAEDLVAVVPMDRIVLETDAPYMAPAPHRGERNESSFIPFIIEKLALAYGTSNEEIADITTATAKRVFNL